VWLQLVHVLVAELFWVLVVLASASLLYATAEGNSDAGQSVLAVSCAVLYRRI